MGVEKEQNRIIGGVTAEFQIELGVYLFLPYRCLSSYYCHSLIIVSLIKFLYYCINSSQFYNTNQKLLLQKDYYDYN